MIIHVSNIEKSKDFYASALAPLHYKVLTKLPDAIGMGATNNPAQNKDPGGDFWIRQGTPNPPFTHIAFIAQNRKEVDEFYNRALLAGGKDNGAPGIRSHYHANYYAAFVLDPDGYNIETVCHLSK